MKRTHPDQHRSGFTLLEILVALSIITVVVALVYGAYRSMFHNYNGIEQQVKISRQIRILQERISKDIESLYTGKAGYFIAYPINISSEKTQLLSFTSAAQLPLKKDQRPASLSVIDYYLQKDHEGQLIKLYRHSRPIHSIELQEKEYILVSKSIKELKIEFIDDKNMELSTWNSQSLQELNSQVSSSEESLYPRLINIVFTFSNKQHYKDRQHHFSVVFPTQWNITK